MNLGTLKHDAEDRICKAVVDEIERFRVSHSVFFDACVVEIVPAKSSQDGSYAVVVSLRQNAG